jgi:hypothetical protein
MPFNAETFNKLRAQAPQAGWRPSVWSRAANVSRATTYNLLSGKVPGAPPLPNVKVGKARIITMAPADYLALCAEQASGS